MNEEIDRINPFLPNTHHSGKAENPRVWMRAVSRRMEHFKREHNMLVKEDTTARTCFA